MRYADPQLVDRLAAAYALGTLSGPARRRFEALHHQRADVRIAVAQWEERLGRLAASLAPVRPSPRVWAAIEARTRRQAPVTRLARVRQLPITARSSTG